MDAPDLIEGHPCAVQAKIFGRTANGRFLGAGISHTLAVREDGRYELRVGASRDVDNLTDLYSELSAYDARTSGAVRSIVRIAGPVQEADLGALSWLEFPSLRAQESSLSWLDFGANEWAFITVSADARGAKPRWSLIARPGTRLVSLPPLPPEAQNEIPEKGFALLMACTPDATTGCARMAYSDLVPASLPAPR